MVSLLRDTTLNAEQQEYSECIKASAGNLLTIVNDILDFSKVESGKLTIERIPFSVASVVEDVGRGWKHVAQQKGLKFLINSFVTSELEMLGDPTRIGQILANLCSNAIKFTSGGAVEFSVSLIESSEAAELRMEVRDEGIGVEPHVLANLFTPFTQGDTSTARLFGMSTLPKFGVIR